MPNLKALTLNRLPDGSHSDGAGLILRVRGGSRSWLFRYQRDGRRRDVSIGTTVTHTLAEARAAATEMRRRAKLGLPVVETGVESRTLRIAVEDYIQHNKRSWRDPKAVANFRNQMTRFLGSEFDTPVESISRDQIESALRKVWLSSPSAAEKFLSRADRLFRREHALGFASSNVADAKILRILLPKRTIVPVHHPAVPWQDAPRFYRELSKRNSVTSYALRWLILSACRSGEARELQIDDLRDGVWELSKTKQGLPHSVPITEAMAKVVEAVPRTHPRSVFSVDGSKPISDMAVLKCHRKVSGDMTTVHGWRSAFRTWAGENGYSRELAETQLGHQVFGKVERAYFRSQELEKRRAMMTDWANFLTGG